MTLADARAELRKLVRDGAECPCCTQFAKVYRFAFNGAMAVGLIRMYRTGGQEWVHVPDLRLPGGHMLKARYWGLIEKPPELVRDDGSKRVGIWRMTDAGAAFVNDRARILSHAVIYNNRCLRLVGDPMTIRQLLGKRFDYGELMSQ